MGAPGQLRADAEQNRDLVADGLDRMIALAEQAGEEETWAWDALSRFVDGCADLRLDPLLTVADAPAQEMGGRRQESVRPEGSAPPKESTTPEGSATPEVGLRPEAGVTPELAAGRARLLEALGRIVGAAHAEGALRLDVGAGDVLGVVGLLIRGLPTLPAELDEELRGRAVRLVLAGMRVHPAPAPPGRPLSGDELFQHLP
ncbi:hypothetical protein ACGFJC_35030 [Nonomuraea fuscirosea]|uniref:hypothetical protein n=1 Tax=Nonomuraea fuscirosea TaxID=1291556 RepID=UPI00371D9908